LLSVPIAVSRSHATIGYQSFKNSSATDRDVCFPETACASISSPSYSFLPQCRDVLDLAGQAPHLLRMHGLTTESARNCARGVSPSVVRARARDFVNACLVMMLIALSAPFSTVHAESDHYSHSSQSSAVLSPLGADQPDQSKVVFKHHCLSCSAVQIVVLRPGGFLPFYELTPLHYSLGNDVRAPLAAPGEIFKPPRV
jgi:hypothetical protein